MLSICLEGQCVLAPDFEFFIVTIEKTMEKSSQPITFYSG